MVDLSLFRLRDDLGDFDSFVEPDEDGQLFRVGPIARDDFVAKLFFTDRPRRTPPWLSFVNEGFPDALRWQGSRGLSALIIINADPQGAGQHFALAFGQGGRHLLRNDAYDRRYGLITALNLITGGEGQPQLREFDTIRHRQSILRTRLQTPALSTIDVFELDSLRDLVRRATGQPVDHELWGRRVGGSDAFRAGAAIAFDQIGELCRRVDEVAREISYRERFGWIDNIEPIRDQRLIQGLEQEVVDELREGRADGLQLAPPDVVDWDRLSRFQYHFDRRRRPRFTRSDLFLDAYLNGVRRTDPDLEEVTPDWLRSRRVFGLDEDGGDYDSWPVWRCLVGEFEYQGQSFVLEDGALYHVAASYIEQLNGDILPFSRPDSFLPPARPGMTEPEYNRSTAKASEELLLLDAHLIRADGTRGSIELCDLLTDRREFVHVKRYGGSQKLSHLFAQARVAAEQLLENRDFRIRARELIRSLSSDKHFDVIEPSAIETDQFEVVIAIIRDWGERDVDSLPFFAKLDLRSTIVSLQSRGYSVSVLRIPVQSS